MGFPLIRRAHQRYPAEFRRPGLRQYYGVGVTDIFEPNELRGDYGAISLWVRPNHAPADGLIHTYLVLNPINVNPASYIALVKTMPGNIVGIEVNTGVPDTVFIPAVGNLTQHVWHHMAAKYSPEGLDLWFDGVHYETLGPIDVGDETLPAASRIYLGTAFIFNADSTLAVPRIWSLETPPDEFFIWLFNNERGRFGV